MNISNSIAVWSLNLIKAHQHLIYYTSPASVPGIMSKISSEIVFSYNLDKQVKNPYTYTCIISQALSNYFSSQTWSNWNPLWSVHHSLMSLHKYFLIFLLRIVPVTTPGIYFISSISSFFLPTEVQTWYIPYMFFHFSVYPSCKILQHCIDWYSLKTSQAPNLLRFNFQYSQIRGRFRGFFFYWRKWFKVPLWIFF